MKLQLLYEDDDIIVINKRAHTLTIPDRFDPQIPNLRELLTRRYGKIYVVHRLDKETSGVIIFARNENAHRNLNDQFSLNQVHKEYLALTAIPTENSGVIENYISENPFKPGMFQVTAKGKYAKSEFEVLQTWNKRYALVKVKIYTGRTHQVRVHMQHINAPLLTDSKYGCTDQFFLSSIKKYRPKKNQKERPLIYRSSLHAFRLSLHHPTSLDMNEWVAALPKDMAAVINQMNKIYGNNSQNENSEADLE